MSITADIIKLRFDVQPKYDQQQMNELKEDLKDTESALKNPGNHPFADTLLKMPPL